MSSQNQNPNLTNAILPGMVEASTEMHHAKLNLTADISEILTINAYEIFDCPIIESTELYAMKSGGELTSRLYSFVEPGGMNVSLRPEFTSSVIRSYISDKISEKQIVKKQYVGPVFRYSDSTQGSNQRQFTQQGCELIGDASADADVEILNLSLLALQKSGLERATVKLGHMGYLRSLLEKFDLSEVLIGFTLSNLQLLTQKTNGIEELSKMAVITAVLVIFFGALTIWFKDPTFIKMKPTIIYLSFAAILIIGLMRKRSLLQSLMGSTLALEDKGWVLLTKRIIIFFISLAFLNELVWRYFGQDQWVNFKTFGMPILSLLFFAFQYKLFQKYLIDKEN